MLIGNGDSRGRPFLLSSPFLRAGQGSLSQTRHGFEGKGLVDYISNRRAEGVGVTNESGIDDDEEETPRRPLPRGSALCRSAGKAPGQQRRYESHPKTAEDRSMETRSQCRFDAITTLELVGIHIQHQGRATRIGGHTETHGRRRHGIPDGGIRARWLAPRRTTRHSPTDQAVGQCTTRVDSGAAHMTVMARGCQCESGGEGLFAGQVSGHSRRQITCTTVAMDTHTVVGFLQDLLRGLRIDLPIDELTHIARDLPAAVGDDAPDVDVDEVTGDLFGVDGTGTGQGQGSCGPGVQGIGKDQRHGESHGWSRKQSGFNLGARSGGGQDLEPKVILSGCLVSSSHTVQPQGARLTVIRSTLLLVIAVSTLCSAEGPTILFFGDSLTSGYSLTRRQAYPAVVQATIDSLGWKGQVVNAGLSGETSAAGVGRINWVIGAHKQVDIFVLELGGNDGLRGVPLASTRENLQTILDRVKAKHPLASLVIAGVLIPPNLGTTYTDTFASIYPRLAEANEATLIPFLLEGVAADPDLNVDDIHPNEIGHRIVGATVWLYLKELVQRRQPSVGRAQDLEGRRGVDSTTAEDTDEDRGDGDDGQDGG